MNKHQETVKNAVRELADTTKYIPGNTDAAFTIVSVAQQTSLAVAGRPDDIVVALAEAMINSPELKEYVIEALSLAMLKDTVDVPCDCLACRINRGETTMSDPNVN